jgi:hypothetical protein
MLSKVITPGVLQGMSSYARALASVIGRVGALGRAKVLS